MKFFSFQIQAGHLRIGHFDASWICFLIQFRLDLEPRSGAGVAD